MKKMISMLLIGCLALVSTTAFASNVSEEVIKTEDVKSVVEEVAVEKTIEKRAIVVVSFGTSHQDTRKVTLDAIENKVRETYTDYDVYRAYTSDFIARIIQKKENVKVESPDEIFARLVKEGYDEVLVQPLHVIPGLEYSDLVKSFEKYRNEFVRAEIGTPLLYTINTETNRNDYKTLIEVLKEQVTQEKKSVVFMGHGTSHPANASYALLERVFNDLGVANVYIGTVEGYPGITEVKNELKKDKVKNVVLMPLMIVAGDHAKNDMAGDEDDSWKKILQSEGYNVETYLHGLGENEGVQKIYINKVADLIKINETEEIEVNDEVIVEKEEK